MQWKRREAAQFLSRGSKLMYGNVLHMLTRPDKRQTVASKGPRNYVDMPHLPPQHENPPPTPLAWPGSWRQVPADVGERSVLVVVTNININRLMALEVGQIRLNQTKRERPYYCSLV